ncbi:MAG TPA: hypothetical protein VIY49_26390 [Bryobacteraceae bacterium]
MLAFATLLLAGCAYIGGVKAPSLEIPLAVTDLRAAEYGDRILVQFTIPMLTTEGDPLKSLGSVDLYAGPANSPFNIYSWSEGATRYSIPPSGPGPYAFDRVPVQDWVGKNIALAVRATGRKGKVSGWSNPAVLSVGPPLATAADLQAANTKDGVRLTWMGSAPKYRVYRSVGGEQQMPIADTNAPEYLDASSQFGTEYHYMVMALEGETQQSVPSQTVPITPKDIFPPSVPAGLTASAVNNAIELAWVRNTEADFRGYNVFRAEGNGPFEKIAMLIDVPVYRDAQVEPGKTYRYQVSAVDLLNNESERSEPVTAALP